MERSFKNLWIYRHAVLVKMDYWRPVHKHCECRVSEVYEPQPECEESDEELKVH